MRLRESCSCRSSKECEETQLETKEVVTEMKLPLTDPMRLTLRGYHFDLQPVKVFSDLEPQFLSSNLMKLSFLSCKTENVHQSLHNAS